MLFHDAIGNTNATCKISTFFEDLILLAKNLLPDSDKCKLPFKS